MSESIYSNEPRRSKIIDHVEAVVFRYAAVRVVDGVERIDFSTQSDTEWGAWQKGKQQTPLNPPRIVELTIVVTMPEHKLHLYTPLYDD